MRESPGHEINRARIRLQSEESADHWWGSLDFGWNGSSDMGQALRWAGAELAGDAACTGQILAQVRQTQTPAATIQVGQRLPLAVSIDDEKLSVSLREARFYDVMDAIAHQTGIQITFAGPATQVPLTDFFSGVSLEDGLRRLLRGQNYIILYSGSGAKSKIARILLISHPGEPTEDFGAQTPKVAEVIGETRNSQGFAEAVKAVITDAGGANETDQNYEGTVAAELHANFQRLLSEGGGATIVNDQLQRLLQQQHQ